MKVEIYGRSDDLIYVRIEGAGVREVAAYMPVKCERRDHRLALDVRARW